MSVAIRPSHKTLTLMRRIDRLEAQLAEEQRLMEDAILFRLAFSYGPPCLLSAHDGQIHRVSNALQQMLGYSKDEIKDKGWQWLTHPDDLKATAKAVLKARTKALDTGYEYLGLKVRYRHATRDWIPVVLHIHVVQTEVEADLIAVVYVEEREGVLGGAGI